MYFSKLGRRFRILPAVGRAFVGVRDSSINCENKNKIKDVLFDYPVYSEFYFPL